MRDSYCTSTSATGMIRVWVASGQHLVPKPFTKWSTSGHTWSVLDIPISLYEEVVKANAEYCRTQRLLRQRLDNSKSYCVCGSDHASLPPEYDF